MGHLLDLHDDHGMVGVTFTVVLSKDLDSILNTVLRDEPSRRLRQEENEEYHKAGCDHLAPDGNSPGDVILVAEVTATKDNPTSNDAADVPGTVVKTGDGSSPGRMGHFTDVTGRGDTAKADTKAQDETTPEEMASVGRCSLNAGTDDDDCSASEHSPSSTEPIVYGGREENGSDGTDVVHGKYDASRGTFRGPVKC